MGNVQVIDRDRLAKKGEIALMNAAVEQLECHERPQVVNFPEVIRVYLCDVKIRPIHQFAADICIRKKNGGLQRNHRR